MKLLKILIPAAVLCSAQAAAETPRLSLWITEAIGATDAGQCAQPALHSEMKLAALRAKISDRIDDADIAFWNPATATWTLGDAATPASDRARQIADHCFVLWINGKPTAAGVALWTHSARLVHMPVLGVSVADGALSLRLGAQHGASPNPPLAFEGINEVLKEKPARAAESNPRQD
ncbi:hypothetical protein [Chitinolyticbacter albus]|uniref:hypothetical protein n=1 Tax=Chitinolyticbacter albus TaxID=2961951 RepID=UPI00210C61D1|nr:hypothetical protein [Chitinolyticbacter albus]